MRVRGVVLLVLLALPAGGAARADDPAVRNRCENLDIGACTALIRAGDMTPHNLAIAYFNRGFAHYQGRDYNNAIVDLDQAVHLDPANAGAFHWLGAAYGAAGDLEHALPNLVRASELDPKATATLDLLGTAYIDKEDYARAIASFSRSIALNPREAPAFNGLGLAYERQAKDADAIANFEKAVALDPRYTDALYHLGNLYAHLFAGPDLDRAIANFRKAIAIAPQHRDALIGLGSALDQKGEYEPAIAAYKKAIALDPKDFQTINGLGLVYADSGKNDLAIATFRQAIAISPDYGAAHYNLAIAYARHRDYARAIASFRKALDLSTVYAFASDDLFEVYRRNGDEARAADDFAKLGPAHAAAVFDRLGAIHNFNGEPDAAIADFNRALALDPNNARAYAGVGDAHAHMGDHLRAIADYKKSIALDASQAMTFYDLGNAYAAIGDFNAAVAAYGKANELDPSDASFFMLRGDAHAALRAYRPALVDYARGIWVFSDEVRQQTGPVPVYLGLVVVMFAAWYRFRRSFSGAVLKVQLRAALTALRAVAAGAPRLVLGGLLPLVIAVAATAWSDAYDPDWDAMWHAAGVSPELIPARASTIVAGLCYQFFAVQAHRAASGAALTWRGLASAYGWFLVYGTMPVVVSYLGPMLSGVLVTSDRLILGVPFWAFGSCLRVVICMVAVSAVARCVLMLPAAAIGHAVSPLRALRMLRGDAWRLNTVVAGFAVFGVGLKWALEQGATRLPETWRAIGDATAVQVSLYLATALIAAALTLFYRERVAATTDESIHRTASPALA